MSTHAVTAAEQPATLLHQIQRDEKGTTAIEFGLIATPFLMMLLGIMSICMYFFTVQETEFAVWQASRDLRTGAFQTGSGTYTPDPLKTPAQQLADKQTALTQAVCNRMRDPVTCPTKMRVMVSVADPDNMVKPNCKSASNNIKTAAEASAGFNAGGASDIVLITGCYSWEFGGNLPYFKLGNLADGSFLVKSTYAFRTEPY